MEREFETDSETILSMLSGAHIGAKVDFQLMLQRDIRMTAELVGIDKNHSLILKFPQLPDVVKLSQFKAGVFGVVRMLLEGAGGICVAFRTEVITAINFPSRLVFFQFPTQIQTRHLREHRRINVFLPTLFTVDFEKASNRNNTLSGNITDISPNGCCLKCEHSEFLQLKSKQSVELSITTTSGEVMQVIGIVKNYRTTTDNCLIGIEFVNSGEGLSFMLDSYELQCS